MDRAKLEKAETITYLHILQSNQEETILSSGLPNDKRFSALLSSVCWEDIVLISDTWDMGYNF